MEREPAEVLPRTNTPPGGGKARAASEAEKKKTDFRLLPFLSEFPQTGRKMLLVLSEDHRDHVALLAKVDPPGKLATRRVTASPSAVVVS